MSMMLFSWTHHTCFNTCLYQCSHYILLMITDVYLWKNHSPSHHCNILSLYQYQAICYGWITERNGTVLIDWNFGTLCLGVLNKLFGIVTNVCEWNTLFTNTHRAELPVNQENVNACDAHIWCGILFENRIELFNTQVKSEPIELNTS